jgi:ABC-type Fe3+ transport system permease subunit
MDLWLPLAIYIVGMAVVLCGMGWYYGRKERQAAVEGREHYDPDPNAMTFLAVFLCFCWPVFLIASPLLLIVLGIGWLGAAIVKFGKRLGRAP